MLLDIGIQGFNSDCFLRFARRDVVASDVGTVGFAPFKLHALHCKYYYS